MPSFRFDRCAMGTHSLPFSLVLLVVSALDQMLTLVLIGLAGCCASSVYKLETRWLTSNSYMIKQSSQTWRVSYQRSTRNLDS